MKAIWVRIGDREIKGYMDSNSVAFLVDNIKSCSVEKAINELTYGVKTAYDGRFLYFTRTDKSGLRNPGKAIVKRIAPKYSNKVDKNPIELYILAAIAAFVIFCSINPEAPICKTVVESAKDTWWYVILPITAFSLGAYATYKILGGRI